jgi:hypothetical protein
MLKRKWLLHKITTTESVLALDLALPLLEVVVVPLVAVPEALAYPSVVLVRLIVIDVMMVEVEAAATLIYRVAFITLIAFPWLMIGVFYSGTLLVGRRSVGVPIEWTVD